MNTQDELVLKDFDQAWEHYRHLESTRVKYLAFFFTVTLAVCGWILKLVSDQSQQVTPITSETLVRFQLATGGLMWLLNLLAFWNFIAVKKVSVVLDHYDSMMSFLRSRIITDPPTLQVYENGTKASTTNHPIVKSRLFSVHLSAEVLLLLAIFVFGAIGTRLLFYADFFAGPALQTSVSRSLLLGFLATWEIVVVLVALRPRWKIWTKMGFIST